MMVTSFLLVLGAMTMTWICDKISESGFGTVLVIFSYFFVNCMVLALYCALFKIMLPMFSIV